MRRKKARGSEAARQTRLAARRGHAMETSPYRAVRAAYEPEVRKLVLELANGAEIHVPVDRLEELAGASDEELSEVEIWPLDTLHWEKLDADVSVAGLLEELLGSDRWMGILARKMGRKGGRMSTPAKARAARENGRRGGRPRKPAAARKRTTGT
ncbi:MAG: DUF2442 domain-containing protein [Gemmatimonadetes bacterium]|nr:DUF2442 domain-containing protein [Gemmatimonadota bacterium]